MDSRTIRCLEISTARNGVSENRFAAAAAESSIDVRGFMAALRGAPEVTKEQIDEFVAGISPQPQYGTRIPAGPSPDVKGFMAALRGEPVVTKEQLDDFVAAI
jgi:hypothetical protein